jgi:ABC-2 type transport system permease protein
MQIISAKYLAAMILIVLALLPTLIYYISIISLGSPQGNIDHGGTWGSYIGLLMLACAYAAIGIFCSSLTDNLVVSFMLAAILSLFACYGFEQMGNLFEMGKTGNAVADLGIMEHYRSMSRGVIDTRDIVYFVAVVSIFTLMTRSVIESGKK